MDKNNLIYLENIFDALEKVERRLNKVGFEEFFKNDILSDSIIRQFEIIGEAANKVSSEFKEKHTEFPWRKVIGLRNILIHDYSGVDLQIVWNICEEYLPILKKQLQKLLQKKS